MAHAQTRAHQSNRGSPRHGRGRMGRPRFEVLEHVCLQGINQRAHGLLGLLRIAGHQRSQHSRMPGQLKISYGGSAAQPLVACPQQGLQEPAHLAEQAVATGLEQQMVKVQVCAQVVQARRRCMR